MQNTKFSDFLPVLGRRDRACLTPACPAVRFRFSRIPPVGAESRSGRSRKTGPVGRVDRDVELMTADKTARSTYESCFCRLHDCLKCCRDGMIAVESATTGYASEYALRNSDRPMPAWVRIERSVLDLRVRWFGRTRGVFVPSR